MLFVTDECLDGRLTRALSHRGAAAVVRVQDVGLRGADDPTILAWCADHDRALITHDRDTMIGFAYGRVDRGEPMPGLVVVAVVDAASLGRVLEDITLIVDAATPEDLDQQVVYVPF